LNLQIQGGVNNIALDCIVESLTDRVKTEFRLGGNEQTEAWVFDDCCDTGLNTWFPGKEDTWSLPDLGDE